jgi:hypothetical protein
MKAYILAACGQPYITGKEVSSNKRRLLALYQHHLAPWMYGQKMFPKEALAKMELREAHQGVYPRHACPFILYTMSGSGIVENDLPSSDSPLGIYLPEHR